MSQFQADPFFGENLYSPIKLHENIIHSSIGWDRGAFIKKDLETNDHILYYYESKNSQPLEQILESPSIKLIGGYATFYLLLENGDVLAFGTNCNHQLGTESTGWVNPTKMIINEPIIDIACGNASMLAIGKNTNNLYGVGWDNSVGRLGQGGTGGHLKQLTKIYENVEKCWSGPFCSYGLFLSEGSLYGFGESSSGALGKSENVKTISKLLDSPDSIKKVACGRSFSFILEMSGIIKYSGNILIPVKSYTNYDPGFLILDISASENNVILQNTLGRFFKISNNVTEELTTEIDNLTCHPGLKGFVFLQGIQGGGLNYDIYEFYKRGEFTDIEINGKFLHSDILKMRGIHDFGLLYELSDKEFNDFILWLYKDQGNIDDLDIGIDTKNHSLTEDMENLFSDRENSDFQIIVEDEEIPIHKWVLIARSGLFRGMFLFTEEQTSLIDQSGLDLESWDFLIEWFYTGKFELTADINVSKLKTNLDVAYDYFQLTDSGWDYQFNF